MSLTPGQLERMARALLVVLHPKLLDQIKAVEGEIGTWQSPVELAAMLAYLVETSDADQAQRPGG